MSDVTPTLETIFARVVERHVVEGVLPAAAEVAGDRPDLVPALQALIDRYLEITAALDGDVTRSGEFASAAPPPQTPAALPAFDGFQTVERIGGGGMGEVYKLRDLQLDRFVAAKVVRGDSAVTARLQEFLREARALALFQDHRIVQIFEFRDDARPPVIVMEYVAGFELGRVGPSLEFRQRARLLKDVCEAIHHAHGLGLQHRDLKPSNIMVDASLSPKILDFGLSAGDPSSGHLKGTLHYLAPEQLDPTQPIDARTDVYALGVILYELLSGGVPFTGSTTADVLEAIRAGMPRLPVEIAAGIPEPLQAIALKAMERRPADRYSSAREMAVDLGRYLDGLPVLARPTLYATTLAERVRPHLDAITEWLRLRLIYPHEADRLRGAYRQFDVRDDDWIASSRALTYSQIALYFGAFLLLAGGLFYFAAHRVHETWTGVTRPLLVLGVPFAGLNLAGRYLYRTERRAVAIALFLSAVSLLPLFLLIVFNELRLFAAAADATDQLLGADVVSNRQLQVTLAVACAWTGWLALRTRTAALSTVFTVLSMLLAVAILADFGVRQLLEDGNYDRIALYLVPVAAVYGALGYLLEQRRRPWVAQPVYIAGALVVVAALDLLALDGKTFAHLGISMQGFQPATVGNRVLIDTLAALSLNGIGFYALAVALQKHGRDDVQAAATLLFVIAPFSALEPLAWLVDTQEYSPRVDWIYLGLAVATAILSHHRQRRSFYYAGVLNAGFALYAIADRRDWFRLPVWAVAVIAGGIAILVLGYWLDRADRSTAARARRRHDVE